MPVVFEKEMGKGTEGCGLFRCSFLFSPLSPPKPILFIPRGANTQKIKRIDHRKCNVRASKNAGQTYFLSSSRLLSSPPHPLKAYCIHSTWSQHTEKRNNIISQMRLRSVFKMRISILNTATTEQMGYDIVSFFVCSP